MTYFYALLGLFSACENGIFIKKNVKSRVSLQGNNGNNVFRISNFQSNIHTFINKRTQK